MALCAFQVIAQNDGYLEGVVKADDTGESLIGVHIKLKGDLSTGAITDINGNYSIKLSEGHYVFIISFTGMQTATLDVNIKSGETLRKEIRLKPYVNELQGVEIKVGQV